MSRKFDCSTVIPISKVCYKFAINKFTVCYRNFKTNIISQIGLISEKPDCGQGISKNTSFHLFKRS